MRAMAIFRKLSERSKKTRQDALQATFSVWVNIFYPPNFRCFEENGLFQQPRLFAPIIVNGVPDFSF